MPALKSKYEDDDIPSAAFFQGIKVRSQSVSSVLIHSLTAYSLIHPLTYFRLVVAPLEMLWTARPTVDHPQYYAFHSPKKER